MACLAWVVVGKHDGLASVGHVLPFISDQCHLWLKLRQSQSFGSMVSALPYDGWRSFFVFGFALWYPFSNRSDGGGHLLLGASMMVV